MSAKQHREQLEQLRERAEDNLDALAFLLDGTAMPALVAELVGELGACVLELELKEMHLEPADFPPGASA